jgi:hypothetical protein
LERLELLIPLPLLSIEPRTDLAQAVGTESEDAQARIVGPSFVGDHASLEKDAKMSAHGRCGEACRISQLARAHRPAAEQLDHVPSRGIREGAEHAGDIHRHCDNS